MFVPNSVFGFIAVISLVLVVLGSWLLHARLRNIQSRIFFLAVLSLAAWIPLSTIASFLVLRNSDQIGEQSALTWLGIATGATIPALLFLAMAVSFLLSVRTIERPNNSFKPKPLRGSA
jgi:hypothetical protein